MLIFQLAEKSGKESATARFNDLPPQVAKMLSDGKATAEIATYKSKAGGKAYERLLLKNEKGEVYDYRMDKDISSKAAWTSEERWKARLGLSESKYDISIGAEKAQQKKSADEGFYAADAQKEKTAKPAENQGKPQATEFFKESAVAPYQKFVNGLENAPAASMLKSHANDGFAKFLARVTAKKENEQSVLDVAFEYGKKYDIDPVLVLAVIFGESEGVRTAVSKSNCIGLMQLMPSTAYSVKSPDGKKIIKSEADLYKKSKNVEAGVAYLASLIEKYQSVPMALDAYNEGPGNANKFIKSNYSSGRKAGAVKYVTKIMGAYKALSDMDVARLHEGMKLDEFKASEGYAAAISSVKENTGKYLQGFDFASLKGFPQENEGIASKQ